MSQALYNDSILSANHLGKLIKICTVIVMVISGIGLLSNLPGLRLIGSFHPNYIPMAPSTAVCFLMQASILYIQSKCHNKLNILYVLSSIILLTTFFGFFIFLDISANLNYNIENYFLPDMGLLNEIPIGRMSSLTGLLFAIAGSAIILEIFKMFVTPN